jgi:DNA-binding transcriptional regulator YhcF (GntR family)
MLTLRLPSPDGPARLALHERVVVAIRRAIAEGQVIAGGPLPPAREVAAALDIHPNTVFRAYRTLRDEGVIDLRAGRGAHVRRDAVSDTTLGDLLRELAAAAERRGLDEEEVLALAREALRHGSRPSTGPSDQENA